MHFAHILKKLMFTNNCSIAAYPSIIILIISLQTTSDDVIKKILKLLRDGTTIAAVRDDKDLTPLYNVFVNGSMPYTN